LPQTDAVKTWEVSENLPGLVVRRSFIYHLTYDAENRLTGVSGAASATFVYDGDGNRVKATFGSATTVYVGNYYEKEGSTVRTYYYADGARVAMREGSTLYYILTDHGHLRWLRVHCHHGEQRRHGRGR
jgi:YD repeat-containing protein